MSNGRMMLSSLTVPIGDKKTPLAVRKNTRDILR
jgi:hypothetical protein